MHFVKEFAQTLAIDVFHDNCLPASIFYNVVHRHDVG